jgi:hypothetical protein
MQFREILTILLQRSLAVSAGSNRCSIACGDFNLRVKEDDEERKALGLQDSCGEIKDAFGDSLMIYI